MIFCLNGNVVNEETSDQPTDQDYDNPDPITPGTDSYFGCGAQNIKKYAKETVVNTTKNTTGLIDILTSLDLAFSLFPC